jgi:hypothetical protein
VIQSNEFYRHNPLCCFSTSSTKGKCIFLYDSVRKLLDTPCFGGSPEIVAVHELCITSSLTEGANVKMWTRNNKTSADIFRNATYTSACLRPGAGENIWP